MKKVLIFLTIIIGAWGCNKESDVGPANEKTFIRYFGTEHNLVAVMAQEDNDGYSLLSTYEIETDVAGVVDYRIHFARTDPNGNLLWENSYPEYDPETPDSVVIPNMTASSFIPLANSGYLIIGNRINVDNSTDLQLLHIDQEGTLLADQIISLDTTNTRSLHGRALIENTPGEFIVLGRIQDTSPNDMFVAKINSQNLTHTYDINIIPDPDINKRNLPVWSRQYGAGTSSVINRIFLNGNQSIWGGSVLSSSTSDVRLIHANENSQTADIGNPIGSIEFNEIAFDFCEALGGWAITGSTNDNTATDPKDLNLPPGDQRKINDQGTDDIYVMKVSNESNIIFKTQIEGLSGQNDRGVSITHTSDQSLVVLGTAGTPTKQEDLVIIKINDSGVEVWEKPIHYGSSDKQEGASIRETTDGSLLIFGTTYFGNEKKLMLMKVDKNGKL